MRCVSFQVWPHGAIVHSSSIEIADGEQRREAALKRYLELLGLVSLLSWALCGVPWAAEYPTSIVRIVVPYPAGGENDILARIVAQQLSEMWGEPVVVENRAGANGMLGLETVARAAPDGYTLGLGSDGPLASNKALYQTMPYDPEKAFAPVGLMATYQYALVVSPKMPVSTVEELIDLARKTPGKLNYASVGVGSPHHLAMELLKSNAKVDMQNVLYRGGAPALNGLMAGEVETMFTGIAGVAALEEAGKLKILAVSGPVRHPLLPEVRRIAEAGYPDYEISNWFGLLAPAGTPTEIVHNINADLVRAMNSTALQQRLKPTGFEVKTSTPDQFSEHIHSEIVRWAEIVKISGAKVN